MNVEDLNPDCKNCLHHDKVYCALKIEDNNHFPDEKMNHSLKKGATIFKENNYPKFLFAIISGKVKISKLGEEGKDHILRFAKRGDLIGYRSLLSEEPYRASAVALTDVKYCAIPKDDFLFLINKNPRLNKEILKKLAQNLREAENKILSISQKSVRERIAETLVLLHHEFGENDKKSLDIILTRKEIGNIAGTTIETTIRTLSDLKKEKLIDFDGKNIIIKSIPDIINIANIR